MSGEQLNLEFVFNDAAGLNGAPRVLSYTQAVGLFDRMADRQDIAFGYAQDGCYARAHIMCQQMKAEGHAPKKAWAFEGNKQSMFVDLPDGGRTYWCYHVTAALPVQMPDGSVQDLVFDPGLFDGPVTLKEWGDIMHAPEDKLEITPYGVPPKGSIGDYEPKYGVATTPETDSIAVGVMESYMKWQKQGPRKVFASLERQAFAGMFGWPQGFTWVSERCPIKHVKQREPYDRPTEQLPLTNIPVEKPGTWNSAKENFRMAAEKKIDEATSTGFGARVKKLWHRMTG